MALYAADGSINVTVVDGTSITGLYAADGSWNVVVSDGVDFAGVYHPCGAYNVTVLTEGPEGIFATDGSLFVQESPYTYSGGLRVTVVSGSLALLDAPIAAWFSGPDVAQALFTIQLPPGTVAGMKVKGESSLDNFSSVLETVITAINGTDLSDGEVEGFAFSPFADGLTYVRFYITNSSESVISEVSNTISETIAASSYTPTFHIYGF